MKTFQSLTKKRLREVLDYNPKTGAFRRKVTMSPRALAGAIIDTKGPSNSRIVMICGKRYLLHRLAFLWMTGKWPPQMVDHINCNPSDNRWINLRLANPSQNCWNARKRKNRKMPKGVRWHKRQNKYDARIGLNYKHIFLGYFDTSKQAHAAYAAAAKKYFGEYARAE